MDDRRKHIRYQCDIIIAIASSEQKIIEVQGKSYDLSQGGIKFYSEYEMELNSFCKIAFDYKDNYHYVEGTILRKDEDQTQNRFEYALEFTVKMSPQDINYLIQQNNTN